MADYASETKRFIVDAFDLQSTSSFIKGDCSCIKCDYYDLFKSWTHVLILFKKQQTCRKPFYSLNTSNFLKQSG